MDISTINTQYMNSGYIPLSSSTRGTGLEAAEGGAFKDILKQAQSSQNSVAKKPEAASTHASAMPGKTFGKTPIDKNDKLYEACMELETFLIKNLIKSMRSTIQKSNLIDSGFSGEIYEDMLYDEYSKEFAKNANFGFAEMAYRELSGTN